MKNDLQKVIKFNINDRVIISRFASEEVEEAGFCKTDKGTVVSISKYPYVTVKFDEIFDNHDIHYYDLDHYVPPEPKRFKIGEKVKTKNGTRYEVVKCTYDGAYVYNELTGLGLHTDCSLIGNKLCTFFVLEDLTSDN